VLANKIRSDFAQLDFTKRQKLRVAVLRSCLKLLGVATTEPSGKPCKQQRLGELLQSEILAGSAEQLKLLCPSGAGYICGMYWVPTAAEASLLAAGESSVAESKEGEGAVRV